MMDSSISYISLLEKYSQTKEELSQAEKSIKRITARHSDAEQNSAYVSARSSKFRPGFHPVADNAYLIKKRSTFNKDLAYNFKKDYESEESSSDEPPSKKPSMPSSVVAKHGLSKSRKATIEEQNTNARIKARNRRMFGTLIGTLEKFQNEEKKRQPVESKRAKIEQKVEAATEEEKQKFRQEKRNLLITRQTKKAQLRCLEKKLERIESHETFMNNYQYLCNFIRTRVKPQMFFLPAKHNPATKKRLADSQRKIKEIIDITKTELEKDLDEIEEMYRKDELDIQISNTIQATDLDQNNEITNRSKCLGLEKKDGLLEQLIKIENTSPNRENQDKVIRNEPEENKNEGTDSGPNDEITSQIETPESRKKNNKEISNLSGDENIPKVVIKQEKEDTKSSENSEIMSINLIKKDNCSVNRESKVDGQQDHETLEEDQVDQNSGKKLSDLYIDYFEPIYD